jgi:hypothetical protein
MMTFLGLSAGSFDPADSPEDEDRDGLQNVFFTAQPFDPGKLQNTVRLIKYL